MDQNERGIIDDLFDRLRRAEGQAEPRDPEAEALIARHVARSRRAVLHGAGDRRSAGSARPGAVQVQELERQLAGAPFGRLFVGPVRRRGRSASRRTRPRRAGLRGLGAIGGRPPGRLPGGRDADRARRRERLSDRGCDLRLLAPGDAAAAAPEAGPHDAGAGRRRVLREDPASSSRKRGDFDFGGFDEL